MASWSKESNGQSTSNGRWEKSWIGNGKENDKSKFEDYRMGVAMEDIPDSAFVKAENGKTYLNFNMCPRKAKGERGEVWNLYVSTPPPK